MRKFLKKRWLIFYFFIICFIIFYLWIHSFYNKPPQVKDLKLDKFVKKKAGDNCFFIKNNWLRKNKYGLWELYLEGSPYERGLINGSLSSHLVKKQEQIFIKYIENMISHPVYLNFLKYFILWFDRDLSKFVKEEYFLEIYGISRSAADKYDYISPKFDRILNYHAAHDIGHALLNIGLVRCTAFAVWGNQTADNSLLIGRNFDFSAGDDFAKDKIVAFINPDKGYKFMMLTWGGMIGVVSGMNMQGLTVTLNSAENKIPRQVATPVTLIAREILQYASNIDEAYKIVKKRKSFVSELILIGSANDKKAAIIEKTPFQTELYLVKKEQLISTNHFLGKLRNNIIETSSAYRYNRVIQLLNKYKKITVKKAITILRDKKGLNDKDIGLGNEKSINQLLAHHAIIFMPEKRRVWVSVGPYQTGKFIAYDLKNIFNKKFDFKQDLNIDLLTVSESKFYGSKRYKQFLEFKRLKNILKKELSWINNEFISNFINSNPQSYEVYFLLGKYFFENKDYSRAVRFLEISLSKEIARESAREQIKNMLTESKNRMN